MKRDNRTLKKKCIDCGKIICDMSTRYYSCNAKRRPRSFYLKQWESKKGFKHSEESKKKMRLAAKGRIISSEIRRKISETAIRNGTQQNENNSQWKGNSASYGAIHDWVRRKKDKPEVCEMCRTKEPQELANISGNYKRNINDYLYLCRRCHKLFDKQIKRNHGRNFYENNIRK